MNLQAFVGGRELLSNTGISEKKLPRAVEVEPALVAEPTCGEGGDMQQGVAAHADHFGTIPAKEGARGKSHAGRVGDATQANRAAMALVGESPTETDEADGKAGDQLETLGCRREAGGGAVSDIERSEKTDAGDENKLARKEEETAQALSD